MVFYSRWIACIIFAVMMVVISREQGKTAKQKISCHSTAFLEGMVGGLIIDSIGVNLGFYYFPREPIYTLSYFGIVLPCWGVFGMLTNYMWDKIGKNKFLIGMSEAYIPLIVFYEGANFITGSWVYTVPNYIVIIGWIPLILTFTACNRRRRTTHKIEAWRQQIQGNGYWQYALRGSLSAVKYTLIVIMFPLLFSIIVKVIMRYTELSKVDGGVLTYIKNEVLMEEM